MLRLSYDVAAEDGVDVDVAARASPSGTPVPAQRARRAADPARDDAADAASGLGQPGQLDLAGRAHSGR